MDLGQTWFKVANEGDKIVTSSPITARYGFGTSWTANIVQTLNTTVMNGMGIPYDPAPNIVKELDILETKLIQSVTVNGVIKIVPALVIAPPPPTIPPSITLNLTLNPLPVILNGIKYSCNSVVLDNTGTLTLICP